MSAARRLDWEGVGRAALSACPGLLHRWFPAGRINGREFVVGNLRGEKGDSLSINIDTGRWADFAGDARGGDLISLYAAMHRLGQGEAIRAIAEDMALPLDAPSRQPSAEVIHHPARADWQPILPVPADAPPPPRRHGKHGDPEHVAEVRDQDGALMYLIYRFPATAERRKQIVPCSYGPNPKTGKIAWRWKSPPAPRPLYGMPLTGLPVLVVEGEVKRDAAARLLAGHYDVVSWSNGADGIGKADWSPLANRDVVVWPDADTPGTQAAAAVVNVLRGQAASIHALTPPEGAPRGWDLADAERDGWTTEQVLRHIAEDRPAHAAEPPPPAGDDWQPSNEYDDVPPDASVASGPFRCLGYDGGEYYFLPARAGQIVRLNAQGCHNAAALVALAPLSWWEGAYPGRKSFDHKRAGNALIRECERVGVFDPERQRGRGVWLDEGRTVVHLGDRLLADGVVYSPAAFPSKFFYEVSRAIELDPNEPLADRDAAAFLRLCCEIAWENPDRDGRLVAGWTVCALVCGAMPWRPHLWLVSEAGKGKSWVEDNILSPILGGLALRVQGKTSEAALRRALKVDARPVLFDEAETQNRADQERMQQVLDLARAASAENGADILKADMSRGNGVVRYSIRSCFYFSSINLALSQAADESRAIVVTLSPSPDKAAAAEQFARLKALHAEIMTSDFGPKLLARTLGLVPTIRHNADILASAIARGGVSRRTGDTLGVVLACAYSLTSTARLTPEEAERFLEARQWIRATAKEREVEEEWRRALNRLLQGEIRFDSANGRPITSTIGEAVSAIRAGDVGLRTDDVDSALQRNGLRIKDGCLHVMNSSVLVARLFADTPWANGWAATLARAPDAKRNELVRFKGIGGPARCVRIQLAVVFDEG